MRKDSQTSGKTVINIADLLGNPFPGLRPFSFEESHLFFGREGQSDEVLEKLAGNRMVAILGASGSGKSSLVFCGLMPILYGGFMASAGANWRIITSRPGISPIDNMAQALVEKTPDFNNLEDEEKLIRKTICSTVLKSTSLGLVEAVRQAQLGQKENILIVIDQFEELFRYRRSSEDNTAINESLAFVKLLLEAVKQEELPIYVALTMRSDFIGDCAQYPDLTKKINDSHYLIPQMTRDQKRLAIVGPVSVGGGQLTQRLVQRLLNDVGDSPDQLPILQHSLMRTWDFWKKSSNSDELTMDIFHYESIGSMSEALSQHANEAYDELSEPEQEICESLFKTLTEKGSDNIGIRRPTKLKDIAAIAKVSTDELIPVIDKFREPGRSLIVPQAGIALEDNTIIDISHESLMRIWIRLKKWTDQEADSVQMYERLCEASLMFHQGKSGLWRPPDLQLALNWKDRQKPNLTWAQQYNPAFERAMVFLDTSRKVFEDEQASKERMQKKQLRQARLTAIVLGAAAIISLIFMVIAIDQRTKALEQQKLATEKTKEANFQKQVAETEKKEANEQRSEAEKQKSLAEYQRLLAEENSLEAQRQEMLALENANEANLQKDIAYRKSVEAWQQKNRAENQMNIAETEKERADRLRKLSIAKSMAVKSLQITDENLQSLLALQAYNFTRENSGNSNDHDIYDGLYYALKNAKGKDFNTLKGHEKSVRAMTFSDDGKTLFSGGSEGKVLAWNLSTRNYSIFSLPGFIIRSLSISPDGKYLAVGGETGIVKVYKTGSPGSMPAFTYKSHKGQVWKVLFEDNNTVISSGSDNRIVRKNLLTDKEEVVAEINNRIKALCYSRESHMLYVGTSRGELRSIRLNNLENVLHYTISGNTSILAITISPDNQTLAFGDEKGVSRLFSFRNKRITHTLTGHSSRINDIQYDKNGKYLASASFDGTIRLWNTDMLFDQPIVLKDHSSWIWTITFDNSGKHVISGCVDNMIRIWPTEAGSMSDDICQELERNLSKKEWERYVAKDIPYISTCDGLPSGNE